jgi:WD40 repeat protein
VGRVRLPRLQSDLTSTTEKVIRLVSVRNFIMLRPTYSAKLPSNAYVLFITALPDFYAAAASSPADTIHLYAKGDLRSLTTLRGHPGGGTTSIRSVDLHATSNGSGQTLASSGRDGYVRIWDLRSKSRAAESAFPKHAHARCLFSPTSPPFLAFFPFSLFPRPWLTDSIQV